MVIDVSPFFSNCKHTYVHCVFLFRWQNVFMQSVLFRIWAQFFSRLFDALLKKQYLIRLLVSRERLWFFFSDLTFRTWKDIYFCATFRIENAVFKRTNCQFCILNMTCSVKYLRSVLQFICLSRFRRII